MENIRKKYKSQFLNSIVLYVVAGLIAGLGSPLSVFFGMSTLPVILYLVSMLLFGFAVYFLVLGIRNYLLIRRFVHDKPKVKYESNVHRPSRKRAIYLYCAAALSFFFLVYNYGSLCCGKG